MDNFESLLEEQNDGSYMIPDVLTAKLLSALGRGLQRSKLLITTRYRFRFDHLAPNVEWVSLYDLSVAEAVSLMGQLPQLGTQGTPADYVELWNAGARNPRLVEFIEAALLDEPLAYLKSDLGSLQGALHENQLLDRLYGNLKEDTQAMLRRASVYRMAVPTQSLEVQVSEYPAQGRRERLKALLDRSLMNKVEREVASADGGKRVETRYRLHESTRQWAEQRLQVEEAEQGIREAQKRGAKAHLDWIANSRDLEDGLEARQLYYAAGEYLQAADMMLSLFEVIHRWGYYDLARSLLQETIDSLEEDSFQKAASLHHLGIVEQSQGNYPEARRLYNESLETFRQLGVGDLSGMASSLHHLGIIEQRQGNYPEARRLYNESLKIEQQLGNLSGMASSLHQLGTLEQDQSNYPEARRLYNESLKIDKQLGNLSGMANSFGQLGTLEQRQGNYPEARRLYNESLETFRQLGNLSGMANSLGQLGRLDQKQADFRQALRYYVHAYMIFNQLNSPYKDTVGAWIAEVREKIGEEQYNAYLAEILGELSEQEESNE